MLEEQNSVNVMLLSDAEQVVIVIIGLRRAGYVGVFKLYIWRCLPLQFNFTELQLCIRISGFHTLASCLNIISKK